MIFPQICKTRYYHIGNFHEENDIAHLINLESTYIPKYYAILG